MNYGCSKDLRKDKRQEKWKKQRKKRGFDDTELWSLDQSLAMHILPRLKAFRKTPHGWPGFCETQEKWNEILDHMIFAFDFAATGKQYPVDTTEEEWERAQKGLRLFAECYFDLWN